MGKMYQRGVLLLLLFWTALAGAFGNSSLGSSEPKFLPVEQAFDLSIERLPDGDILVRWEIAPKYYLYQQRLTFEGLAAEYHPSLPPGEAYSDEFFGDSEVYRDHLELRVTNPEGQSFTLGWQGCADAGLCYPPQQREISGSTNLGNSSNSALATDQQLASDLQGSSLPIAIAVFFGLGLLLAFTPCSLPMLPILSGLVVGSGASSRRALALASVYIISMALVYAVLGVLAALAGTNLQASLQQPWLLFTFAGLFIVLALPMFGFFELQLPVFLRDRLDRAGRKQTGGHLVGAAMLGLFSGLLIGPCMTAPLAGALLYIAQSGDAVQGGLALFALGVGMGVPLLILVTLGNRFLPRPGPWMDRIKALFGFGFLAAALYIARPAINDLTWMVLTAALLITIALALWQTARVVSSHQVLVKSFGTLTGVWGLAMLLGAAGGATDPLLPLDVYTGSTIQTSNAAATNGFKDLDTPQALDSELAAAKAAGEWVLIDYYADWCISCKIMEKNVFGRADVMASLEGVRLLRPDVTHNNNASRELLARYSIHGPPTMVWIGPNGEERRSQRITGEVNAAEFLQIWNKTQEDG